MGYMKDLAIECMNHGIDYTIVNLEDVEALIMAYKDKTGHEMTWIEGIIEIYECTKNTI